MVSTTSPTATLCHWVCATRYGDLPAKVRQETVIVLYDQVGCMIASATLPSCQPVVELVCRLSPPGACSIVGHPVRTSVTNAALANGTIGHGDEVDATGQRGTGHYATTTVPTALSTGQYVGASGQEFIALAAVYGEITFQHIHDPSYREDPRVKAFRGPGTSLDHPTARASQHGAAAGYEPDGADPQWRGAAPGAAVPPDDRGRDPAEVPGSGGLRLESRRVADLERQLKAIAYVENVAPLIRELELDS
jgi:MmgE/PrpD N-terminal domain